MNSFNKLLFRRKDRLLTGFTLIELLVVISIIGLMVTIVLINMRNTQAEARDAKIKDYMHQVRNAAEMSYDKYENYDKVCDEGDDSLSGNGEFRLLEIAIKGINKNQDVACYESTDKGAFAASSPMVARKGKCWCVESAGLSIELNCQSINSANCQCP